VSSVSTPGRFRDLFGRDAEVAWRSPGRVNLIGEHTDYNDGFVLPLALTSGTDVRAARREDRVLRVASVQRREDPVEIALDDLAPGSVDGWAAYVAGVFQVLAREHGVPFVGGAAILVESDVPEGKGVSSSAAIEAATMEAVLGRGASRSIHGCARFAASRSRI